MKSSLLNRRRTGHLNSGFERRRETWDDEGLGKKEGSEHMS